jgi:hypothetical protein
LSTAGYTVADEDVDRDAQMRELTELDLAEIATALGDQTDYEHQWLIDPRSGELVFWTADTGIDGHRPVEPDELDLVCVDPLPSYVWYRDLADFAEGVSDQWGGRRLARAIQGRARSGGSRTAESG